MEPENGRSAIVAAARAIARTPLGRLDAETTCNVGLIDGGTVRNAVPVRATIDAEARSLDDARLDRVLSDLREHWSPQPPRPAVPSRSPRSASIGPTASPRTTSG